MQLQIKQVLRHKSFGKLSLGQVSELAGYSKETFMELLADYGGSLINYPPSDIIKDAGKLKLASKFFPNEE